MDIQTQDGILLKGIPEGTPDDVIKARIQAIRAEKAPQQEASTADKIAAFPATRFAIGAAKPILGAAQFAANLLPDPAPTMSQLVTGEKPQNAIAKAVNEHLATLNDMTERGAKTKWGTGGEVADFAGQVLSPVNAGVAKLVPMAGGAKAIAAKGAALGAAGAATDPIMDREEQRNFWDSKGAKTAIGTVAGGVASPVISKVAEAVMRRLPKGEIDMARASLQTDQIIKNALADIGQKIDDLPKIQYDQLRQQVLGALKKGKELDAAALMRKADFEQAGMPALQGQITRDATQFARERNLRGVAGVGEPIMQRIEQQNKSLQSGIGQFVRGNSDELTAGEKIAAALKSTDDSLSSKVSDAYKAAKQSSGKDWDVPLQGLAQDASRIVKDYAEKVPGGVKNRLDELGVFGERQKKVFTFEDADSLLKLINSHVGNDKVTNTAMGELRASIKKAMMDAPTDDVFAGARNLASQRFKLHDLIPALKAASDGNAPADSFVRKFVNNAPTKEVKAMASLLRQVSPESLGEARDQIGQRLQRAAFGENVAGDKIFSPERYAKVLREIGDQKLSAFFNKTEIDQLKRFGRVGAYINSVPSAAPVSSSNSNLASMLTNYGSKIPTIGPAVAVGKAIASPIANQRAVNASIAADVPVKSASMSPEQRKQLARLLGTSAIGLGVAQ